MHFSLLFSTILVILCFTLQFSCAFIFNSDSHTSRGKLSEAVKKSSDDYEGERKVADSKISENMSWRDKDHDEYGNIQSRHSSSYRNKQVKVKWHTSAPPEKFVRDSADYLKNETKTKDLYYLDSSGNFNLDNYILQLSIPFAIKSDVNQIVISTTDSTGKQNDLKINREKTDADTSINHDSSSTLYKNNSSGEWVVTEDNKVHYLGIKIFSGLKYSSNYANITGGSILWAYHFKKKQRASLHFGAAIIPTREDSDLFGSIDELDQIHLGYQHRIYFTPDHTIFGIYLPIDAVLKLMLWRYNNPIVTDVYGEDNEFLYSERITDDGLIGFSLGTGIGFSLMRLKRFRLSSEITLGGTFYSSETINSFTNDVFTSDGYLMLSLECDFGISNVRF